MVDQDDNPLPGVKITLKNDELSVDETLKNTADETGMTQSETYFPVEKTFSLTVSKQGYKVDDAKPNPSTWTVDTKKSKNTAIPLKLVIKKVCTTLLFDKLAQTYHLHF